MQVGIGLGLTNRYGSSSFPLSLFAGKQGAYYDPSDLSTLWKDAARTQPVTADGDLVRTMDDKSGNGKHLAAPDDATAPIYRTDGTLHWLEFNGSKRMVSSATVTLTLPSYIGLAISRDPAVTSGVYFSVAKNTSNYFTTVPSTGGRFGANLREGVIGSISTSTQTDAFPEGPHVYDCWSNPGNTYVYADGALEGTIANGWIGATTLTLCAINIGNYGTVNASAHDFYGAIFVCSDTTGSLSDIRDWLRDKCGMNALLDQEMDVFVIGGQSNAISRADAAGDVHPAGCYQFNGIGTRIFPATVPLDHVAEVAGDLGPDVVFATEYLAANPGRKILFVPVAQGGTRFGDGYWRAGGVGYNRLIANANAAMAQCPNATFKGYIISLGESDSASGLGGATFQTDVDTFIANIRANVTGASIAPVVWFGMTQDWVNSNVNYRAYQNVLAAVGTRNDYAAYVDSESPSVATTIALDTIHFDRAGINLMAERAYDALLVAQANTP